MSAKVVVIGAGNIGTRHLQAILKCGESLEIFAVEPNKDAQKKSQEILGKISSRISYFIEIDELPKTIDIAIVAVNSGVRRQAVEQLLAYSSVKYMILEKVLFPYVKDYPEVEELLRNHDVKTWVNCARRSWPYTQTLKEYFCESSTISMCVRGNMWGLGCNSIHFIDFLSHLTGRLDPVNIDISGLDDTIIPSKRSGYVEFTGELNVQIGPHNLKLISSQGVFDGFDIDIKSERIECHIKEKESSGVNFITNLSFGTCREELFEVPFQSSLTTQVLTNLLLTGTCPLTLYNDSIRLHVPMLRAFAEKLNGGSEYCNIT